MASRWARKAAHTIVLAAALGIAAGPQSASASWTRISSTRSSTEPYFACPPQGTRPECDLIEDPARGTADRGPIPAGAITTGPEEQLSPSLDGNGVSGGYSPENLRSAYDLPSTSAGFRETVGIVNAYDDPNAEADLKVYRSEYGLPACNASSGCFRKVNQTGGSSSYPAANRGWAEEVSLDLDMISAVCPNCRILLVEANTNGSADFAAAENEAVALGATEISNSFGGPTLSEPPEDASAYDHPGIPITAAGGDHGYGVQSPASNPHVIAVGGTSLLPTTTNSRGWTEEVWYEDVGRNLRNRERVQPGTQARLAAGRALRLPDDQRCGGGRQQKYPCFGIRQLRNLGSLGAGQRHERRHADHRSGNGARKPIYEIVRRCSSSLSGGRDQRHRSPR